MTMSIFLALGGAFVGAFFGALFKEQMGDLFFKRKRKRELRGQIIKEISGFHFHITMQMNARNLQRAITRENAFLQKFVDDTNGDDTRLVNELIRKSTFANELADESAVSAEKANVHLGNIYALLQEFSFYAKSNRKSEIKTIIAQIRSERNAERMDVELYNGEDYDRALVFRRDSLQQKINELDVQKTQRFDKIIGQVELLVI